MKRNKIKLQLQACILGGALLLFCSSVGAIPYTEILNETAPAGTTTGPGNGPPTSQGVQPDVNPTTGDPNTSVGGHSTLLFALSNNGGNQMVPGDVLIYEDAAHTILSDVLRFEDWGVGYVYVYSATDDGPLTLADTGMPTAFQANQVSFTEQFNGSAYGLFGYTPTANQPGYSTYLFDGSTSIGLNYTYNFTSDEIAATPDGGVTVGLLGMSLVGIAALKRKFAK